MTSLFGPPKKRPSRLRERPKSFQQTSHPSASGHTINHPSTWALQFPMQHRDLLAGSLSPEHHTITPRSTASHQQHRPLPKGVNPTIWSCPRPQRCPPPAATHAYTNTHMACTHHGLSPWHWPKDTSHPNSGPLTTGGRNQDTPVAAGLSPPGPGQPSHTPTKAHRRPNPAIDVPTCTQRDMHEGKYSEVTYLALYRLTFRFCPLNSQAEAGSPSRPGGSNHATITL